MSRRFSALLRRPDALSGLRPPSPLDGSKAIERNGAASHSAWKGKAAARAVQVAESGGIVISAANIDHEYHIDGTVTPVLSDFSLNVNSGEFVAIVGPSGCGKTTFLNIVAGLEPLMSGDVQVAGARPMAGRPGIGYAPVRDSLLPWRRAIDNAALQLELWGMPRDKRYARVRDILSQMDLTAFAEMYPAQLSQGMRQRIALARLFAAEPSILLLDEPFSALDAQTRVVVQGVFLKIREHQSTTVVLVTHDIAEAVTLADRIVVVTRRPGHVKATYDVSIPRPRHPSVVRQLPEFHATVNAIWNDLRNDLSEEVI